MVSVLNTYLILALLAITVKSQPVPGNNNMFAESHGKLDNLIHATSHKVLEAQAAGQAFKEFEHNIENYIAWSAHNTVSGFQTMPMSSRSFFELDQILAALGQTISLISNGVGDENAMVQKRFGDHVSKLAGLNEELRKLRSSLDNLYQTSTSYFKKKMGEGFNPRTLVLSYEVPELSRNQPFNWIAFVAFQLVFFGAICNLYLWPRSNHRKTHPRSSWHDGLA